MNIKIHYEAIDRDDLKRYAKDSLTLIRQNWWLSIKLIVFAFLFSCLTGALVVLPDYQGHLLSSTEMGPIIAPLFDAISESIAGIFSAAPFWMILFFTGFRIMENKGVLIPVRQVISLFFRVARHFWTSLFIACIFAGILFISYLGYFLTPDMAPGSANESSAADTMTLFHAVSLFVVNLSSETFMFGLVGYWFSFLPLLIYQFLLFGKESVPTLGVAYRHATSAPVMAARALRVTFLFMLCDIAIITISLLSKVIIPGGIGVIVSMGLKGFFYLFVAGILYAYCVDKIEDRSLKKKVKEEAFSPDQAPSAA